MGDSPLVALNSEIVKISSMRATALVGWLVGWCLKMISCQLQIQPGNRIIMGWAGQGWAGLAAPSSQMKNQMSTPRSFNWQKNKRIMRNKRMDRSTCGAKERKGKGGGKKKKKKKKRAAPFRSRS
jgi:hypothetical protein